MEIDAKRVLDLPMQQNDAGAKTVRQYLVRLAREVWIKDECFSGKRPFGNSGWKWDLYLPLVKAGLIDGRFDEDERWLEEVDEPAGSELIIAALDELEETDREIEDLREKLNAANRRIASFLSHYGNDKEIDDPGLGE